MRNIDPTPALLELKSVVAGYGGRGILPPIDLAVEAGQTWALIGRNGSGKTTLLRTLIGIVPPVSGAVVRRSGVRAAYVAQRGDYDHAVPARVIDFVRGGVDRGWSFARPGVVRSARPIVEGAMRETGVEGLATRRFSELSEGQKQRVLIARALAGRPDLIVLDEPTSAMDPIGERAVFELLDRLRRAKGISIVIASHEMSLLPEMATHAVLVDAEDGVAEIGGIQRVIASESFHHRYGFALAGSSAAGEQRQMS